jgi:serine/threonine protein kinase
MLYSDQALGAKIMESNLIGKTLGQYKLVEIAGEGGLATVYKAYQANLERWVAIKVLHSANRTMLARFARAAKAVACLRHPNILPVYEYAEEKGWPYIAMQFIEKGQTLSHLGQNGPLDWRHTVALVIPIARALHYAHEHGLIHRDIKPSNILLGKDGSPLLADFGLVKDKDPSQSLTDSNAAIGTPAYIPPEQVDAQEVDGRADMYSLGVVMFELITGRLPFAYQSATRLLLAHAMEPPPAPRDFNPDCPLTLEGIILKTLQKSPDERYANLVELVGALKETLSDTTLPIIDPQIILDSFSIEETIIPEVDEEKTHSVDLSPQQRVKIFIPKYNTLLDVPAPASEAVIIGRSHSQAKVDLDLGPYGALEAGISRRHVCLFQRGTAWFIDDLGSMNGTYVNEVKLIPGTPAQVSHNDEIRCSTLTFILRIL